MTALLSIALCSGTFLWLDAQLEQSGWTTFGLALLPNLIVAVVAFVIVLSSQGLGLWGRSDKLDAVYNYIAEERQAAIDQIQIAQTFHEISWPVVFGSGPICIVSNFATAPLRQGGVALAATFQQTIGHVAVLLDPIDNDASMEAVVAVRARDAYANTVEGMRNAIADSVALLLDGLPPGANRLDSPLLSIKILLTRYPSPFVAYAGGTQMMLAGHDVFPLPDRGPSPKLLLTGLASLQPRSFVDSHIRTLAAGDDARVPTLHQLIEIGTLARGERWAGTITSRLVKAGSRY